MKRLQSLFFLFFLGCATAEPGAVDIRGGPQIQTVMAGAVVGGESTGTSIRYVGEPVIVEEVVPAPREEVWPLLLEAYRAEGLEPDGADSEAGILTLSRVEWSRTLNGVPLSTFLNCGPSATGRPLADDARIVSAIASQVATEENGATRVVIRFEAVAFPFDASLGLSRTCTSEGKLEREILNRIQTALSPVPVGSVLRGNEVRAQPAAPNPPTRFPASDLPMEPGEQMRVWITPSIRITGSYMGIRQDTLFLRRSRETALPIWSIEAAQVKRTRRSPTVIGSLVGIAAGITLALTTDLGIGGDHAVQGDILNPGLGALLGGLAGAGVGTMFFGTSWEDVPLERVRHGPYRPERKEKSP